MGAWTRRLTLLLAALAVLAWAAVNRPSRPAEPYTHQPVELPPDLALPDSRLVALGSATHGNAEPVEAARLLLERMHADGGAALLLEENAGAAARVNDIHAYEDPETGRGLGFYPIYNTEEMADLLGWMAENGVRLYGVDVQSVQGMGAVLRSLPAAEGFPDPERLDGLALHGEQPTESLLSERLVLLEELETYVDGQVRSGAAAEAEAAYARYLTGSVRLHYEYLAGGERSDHRDRLMAENALRALALEETYYGTRRALLFASSGHVGKTPYHYDLGPATEYTPMGRALADALGSDYYVLLTESRFNTFLASPNLRRGDARRPFSIQRTGPLLDALTPADAVPRLVAGADLAQYGAAQGDITMVGWYFKNARTRDPRWFAVPTDLPAACDGVLLFRQLTPARPPTT